LRKENNAPAGGNINEPELSSECIAQTVLRQLPVMGYFIIFFDGTSCPAAFY
jgi:hypothetical protein